MLAELMNWRMWVATALFAASIALSIGMYKAGERNIQQKWDAQITQQALETQKLVEDARAKEQELQQSADKLRKAKNAQINQLATDLADALDRLRQRPSRSGEGDLPQAAGTGGCTGANLFRQDSEFLVREANRADRLLADLAYCQAQYTKARQLLNGDN